MRNIKPLRRERVARMPCVTDPCGASSHVLDLQRLRAGQRLPLAGSERRRARRLRVSLAVEDAAASSSSVPLHSALRM